MIVRGSLDAVYDWNTQIGGGIKKSIAYIAAG
jgi:hypothetical protein